MEHHQEVLVLQRGVHRLQGAKPCALYHSTARHVFKQPRAGSTTEFERKSQDNGQKLFKVLGMIKKSVPLCRGAELAKEPIKHHAPFRINS